MDLIVANVLMALRDQFYIITAIRFAFVKRYDLLLSGSEYVLFFEKKLQTFHSIHDFFFRAKPQYFLSLVSFFYEYNFPFLCLKGAQ